MTASNDDISYFVLWGFFIHRLTRKVMKDWNFKICLISNKTVKNINFNILEVKCFMVSNDVAMKIGTLNMALIQIDYHDLYCYEIWLYELFYVIFFVCTAIFVFIRIDICFLCFQLYQNNYECQTYVDVDLYVNHIRFYIRC